ncbi:MAG: SsrA-binding protein SmpB [Pseudomonadota bacterium]|nr:SsrA-binding protein SmpB [Pseudomonadota bacterium]
MSKHPQKKTGQSGGTITLNKKAKHEFFIEDKFEAGIVLEGWEVKSLRAGKVQMRDSYVLIKNGEAFLIGTLISPLNTASTHIHPSAERTRKLLLNRHELSKLIGAVERQGYTVIPIAMYWSKNLVKVEIGLAKGKQEHDKRNTERDREWARDKQRIMKRG